MRAILVKTGWSLGGRERVQQGRPRGVLRRSLVPNDVPQLVQRPPDAILLERQFRPPAGLDSFNVNDEVRVLFDSFRELPRDLQISYNIVIILALVVVFVAFEGVELLRELDSNTKYVDELKEARKPEGSVRESQSIIRERRRGLGWLALVTGIAVWATGALNAPNPFGQP